jgi:NAD(P)-dependent dehydrogenase (short-subunit alcohol dehydrogenase family)
VAILFAKEGADIAISYLSEQEDAKETKRIIEQYGATMPVNPGDVSKETVCKKVIQKTIDVYGKLTTL